MTVETQDSTEIRELQLWMINEADGTQARVHVNEGTIETYRGVWLDGGGFPPIDVYYDGETFYLADGFHRLQSAKRAGLKAIPARLHKGGRRDAALHAIGANADHGLPRSNEDKRRAVDMLLQDPEWGRRSLGWLAEAARVSKPFVAKRRARLGLDPETVVGLDGKEYAADGGAAGLDADAGEDGGWDPWGGREGEDAKAWLSTVDDWRLAELLMHKPPKGLKTQTAHQFEYLKRIALGRWHAVRETLEMELRRGEPGPWLWSAVNRRILQLPLSSPDVLGADALAEQLRTLTSFHAVESLIRRPLVEDLEADAAWRCKLLRLLIQADRYQYTGSWTPDSMKQEQADLLRPLCPSFADAELAKHEAHKAEQATRQRQTAGEEAAEGAARRAALAGIIAGAEGWRPADLATPLEAHLVNFLQSELRWPSGARGKRSALAAVLARHHDLAGAPVDVCPDPVCGAGGGWRKAGTHSAIYCWRCDRPEDAAKVAAETHLAYVQEMIRLGLSVELEGAAVGAPALAPAPPAPPAPTTAGDRLSLPSDGVNVDTCPLCLSRKVGYQHTLDRGEVLAEHPLPFDDGQPCPGSFLPPARAHKVMEELDHAAPEIVRILSALQRLMQSRKACREVGTRMAEHTPDLWALLEAWIEDGSPGSAVLREPQSEQDAA